MLCATSVCVENGAVLDKLSILPNRYSSVLYDAVGAYCGTIWPLRSIYTNVRFLSVCVVPKTPEAARVEAESSVWYGT